MAAFSISIKKGVISNQGLIYELKNKDMKIKRFNWINKLFTFTQETDEKLFSSNRQKDIKEWLDLSRSLVYEIIKLVEFYDVGKDNREHWINSLTEKLIIKNNQFSYLFAASLLEDPAYLISSKDIKDRIFGNLHGKELLNDVWKKDMRLFKLYKSNWRVYEL